VGDALARSELTGSQMEPLPMDACVAETQGSIGSLLQQALQKTLQRHGLSRPVVTIVTQVLISPRDPALRNLTKPVGPLYNQTACPAKLRNWAATISTRGLPRKARQ
jgi:carbamate kinase